MGLWSPLVMRFCTETGRRWPVSSRAGWTFLEASGGLEWKRPATPYSPSIPRSSAPDGAFGLLERLEEETRRRFAGRRLLCTTQLNHRRVVSLDELPAFVGEHAMPGMLPTAPAAERRALVALNEFDDHRLVVLLGGLTLQEARIVQARGFLTAWEAAALSCGSPRGAGERVRAKVLRRAQRINKLTSGSQPTSGR